MKEFIAEYVGQVATLRRSRYMDYPTEVAIETQAVCNAACDFCPYPALERKGTKMSDELIAKIIGDLEDVPADVKFIVSPFKVSDPLLDVRIFDICRRINERLPSASIRLFTNGSALTEAKIGQIAGIGRLLHLWVSLNSHEEAEYERVMQIPFRRTLANLDRLHAKKAAGEFPHMVWVSKVLEESPADDAFHAFLEERYPLFGKGLILRSEWLGQIDGLASSRKIPLAGCARWFEMSVTATGQVSFCCMDGKCEYPTGDASQQHLLAIYNSPGYRRYREQFVTRLEGSPCMACTHF